MWLELSRLHKLSGLLAISAVVFLSIAIMIFVKNALLTGMVEVICIIVSLAQLVQRLTM